MKSEWMIDGEEVFDAVIDYMCRKYKITHIDDLEVNFIDETDKIIEKELGIRLYGDVTFNLKEK